MDWREVIGFIGGFLTTMGMIPQVWRLFRMKSAHEISISFSLLLNTGIAFWLIYGISAWTDRVDPLERHRADPGPGHVLCQDEVGPIGRHTSVRPFSGCLPVSS